MTLAAVTSSLLWIAVALITVRSFWYTDTFSILLSDPKKEFDLYYCQLDFYELSSNCGRFYIRVALRTDDDPFRHNLNLGWFNVRIKSGSRFAENMERLTTRYGANQRQFLGFHWASGDPSRKSGDTLWIRFIRGPIWPLLLVFAILPVGLFWWRRRWPCEQRRAAVRITLIGYSLPMTIAVILLILAIINTNFLGPGEKPLSGRSSHPAVKPTSDANGIVLKVMTYNIWMGGAYKGAWRFEKPEIVTERIRQIGNLIRENNPDLVFLQEVVLDSGLGSFNQAPVLAEKTGMHMWVFGQCINDGLPFYRMIEGNAILSRWPLEPLTNQKMAGNKAFYEIGYDDQSTLWCKADIGGQEILLASVHLNASDFYEVRLPQVQQLLDFAGDQPAILAGDFNADPNELEIRRIVDTGKFAAKLNGPFTISSYDPHRTIDHIFVPRDWQLLEHRVIQTDLSDHLPVLSTFRIPLVADRD